jgi:hypothetical protein
MFSVSYGIKELKIKIKKNPVGARFSAPVQTGPEAHPASCAMGTGSFQWVSCGRGLTLTPNPLLVPRSKIE